MGPAQWNDIYHGWNTRFISMGELQIGLAPEIGGRIISLKYAGQELMFVQEEHAGETHNFPRGMNVSLRKRELGFRLWGGDKTWVAPQSDWMEGIPPLDLDAGPYTMTKADSGGRMTSRICNETGLVIHRTIRLHDDNTLEMEQSFTNESDHPIERGIWDVTQMLRPFLVYLPIGNDSIRPYASEGDSVNIKDHYVKPVETEGSSEWSLIHCQEPVHFKFGATIPKGHLLAVQKIDDKTAIVHGRQFSVQTDGPYLHNSNVEVYNSPDYDYMELEVHAPFQKLAPMESQTHSQTWKFMKTDLSRIGSPEQLIAELFG